MYLLTVSSRHTRELLMIKLELLLGNGMQYNAIWDNCSPPILLIGQQEVGEQ